MSAAVFNPDLERPVLCIDTSSAQGNLALYDGAALATRSWPAERSHTTTLLAEIHHLLEAAAVRIGDLAAVGVAIGPGAFTGLRAGFGVAKGFHLATSVPLVGVSTLKATALPFASGDRAIVATVPAGRGRLVSAIYDPTTSGLVLRRAAHNSSVVDLASELETAGALIVAGELADDQAALLADAGNVLLPPRPLRMRQPAALAELAWHGWKAGESGDAAAIEPLYLSR
ncbi:MAG: tRNA (adenosine(37)-N6)-threonylcarbamoyltransferase complex dimerization subunit type 1 TsaB [Thermomicrobiales bacterium]|nr:tRNA (adenosine(37)-N6)-threonylcarbamoyltransferase complex dimerization subunit type 1 TsaB [Thermomicrobiales bacterium]